MRICNRFFIFLIPFFLISMNTLKLKKENSGVQVLSSDPNKISWDDSIKLKYTDFKGKVPIGTTWAAQTSSSINLVYGFTEDSLTSWSANCFFDKTTSWIKTKTADVLNHEQLHFEIAEITARILRKKIIETKYWGTSARIKMEKYFNEVNNNGNDLQNAYDKETGHGTIKVKQTEWELKIDSLLVSYNSFK